MRILIILTYFQPHKSGLTVYAVRQARALASRGHKVTVLTSRYDPALPLEEWDQGVRILRLKVAFRLSKGVIMPTMPFKAWKLIRDSDVVNLHVPQVDAALAALLARLLGKPLVLTYHCDLQMPAGLINQAAGWAAGVANRISAGLADVIVHNTRDFAEHSPFLRNYLHKLQVIQPPIIVTPVSQDDIAQFRDRYAIRPGDRVVGMVARLATEKGVEYLVAAMPSILETQPEARAVFVGEYKNVFGEEAYQQKLLPMIEKLDDRWLFTGVVSELEKAVFYHLCDVLVLPSINSTESFGMVQVEAMTCGTPVAATDLPGVRQPVQSTGMGRIVPQRNPRALAEAVLELLSAFESPDAEELAMLIDFYSPETVARAYEDVFEESTGGDR
jgi:glycosyltransferase involved in cell wall biosynthesis